MILSLLIRCWLLLPLQDSVIVLFFVTLCPFLFCDHLDGEEKELAALLSLSSWCLMIVVWLFLSVPWVCLQFVIVILTYYFWVPFMRTAMALAILPICLVLSEPSSQFTILMWWLKWRLNAILCEHRRIWRVCTFAQAYLSIRNCTKSLVQP